MARFIVALLAFTAVLGAVSAGRYLPTVVPNFNALVSDSASLTRSERSPAEEETNSVLARRPCWLETARVVAKALGSLPRNCIEKAQHTGDWTIIVGCAQYELASDVLLAVEQLKRCRHNQDQDE